MRENIRQSQAEFLIMFCSDHNKTDFLGKVYAISLDTRVGVEDCLSITNNNLLQMSLIQLSCQSICLPAKDSSKFNI